ncbi:MAG: DNA-3-methyladenine glycosylase I [Actinomycetes bacterium]
MSGAVTGDDGLARCPWGLSTPDYVAYHDDEWGRPVHGDVALFERVSLEAFREVFAGFDAEVIAAYGDTDAARLMEDARIVRNRLKIAATIANARAVLALAEGLDELLWSFAPPPDRAAPRTLADVPAVTPESAAMAKELKRRGFRFVGPTTAYALMQATGMVDDHLVDCAFRG